MAVSALSLLRAELDELAEMTVLADEGLPPYALFGSVVMLFHGLRKEIGDVDVFVDPAIWRELAGRLRWSLQLPSAVDPPFLESRCGGFKVHAFYRWTPRDPWVDAEHCRWAAEQVHGWWCTPLWLIRQHKTGAWECVTDDRQAFPDLARWEKHARDVEILDRHLAELA